MTQLLPAWQRYEPRRSSALHGAAVFTLIGVIAGTGGYVTREQFTKYFGTGSPTASAPDPRNYAPEPGFAIELKLIRESLRLSVADTAKLFGVTRPTIYSWQNGNPINPENADRLRAIVRALAPHLQAIESQSQVGRVAHRAIDGPSTLLQKLAQGADAQEAIGRLTDILSKEAAQRERLARRLQGRSGNHGAADLDVLG